MRRLVCAFVVRKPLKTGFLASGPVIWYHVKGPTLQYRLKLKGDLSKVTKSQVFKQLFHVFLFHNDMYIWPSVPRWPWQFIKYLKKPTCM